jgi:hypothetical protein
MTAFITELTEDGRQRMPLSSVKLRAAHLFWRERADNDTLNGVAVDEQARSGPASDQKPRRFS